MWGNSVKSEFDAVSFTNNFGSAHTNLGNINKTKSSYSMVGINVNEIPKMKEAVKNYVAAINTIIDGLDEKGAKVNTAFKGEAVEVAVKKYIANSKQYCLNYVSQLYAFVDKLDDVLNAWQTSQASFGSAMSDASKLNAGEEAYKSANGIGDTVGTMGDIPVGTPSVSGNF